MSAIATCIGRVEEKMKKDFFLTRSPLQLLLEQVPGPKNSGSPVFKGILGSGRVCVQVSQDSMSYRFWRPLTRRTAYDRNPHVMSTKPWHKILQNLLPPFFLNSDKSQQSLLHSVGTEHKGIPGTCTSSHSLIGLQQDLATS